MPAKHTKSIALTPQWGQWIDDLVASGEYQSASEVVRDGLRALRNNQERKTSELAEIQARFLRAVHEADNDDFAAGSGEEAIMRAFEAAQELAKK